MLGGRATDQHAPATNAFWRRANQGAASVPPSRSLAQVARRKLANAVVVGFIDQDRVTHLNPPDSTPLTRSDKLIVLSHSARPELAPGGSTAAGLDVAALQQRLEAAQPPPSRPKSIVVVGWSGPTADLVVSWGRTQGDTAVGAAVLREPACRSERLHGPGCAPHPLPASPSPTQSGLCDFAAPGTEVTLLGSERPPDFPGEEGSSTWEVQGRTLHYVEGGILDRWGHGAGGKREEGMEQERQRRPGLLGAGVLP